MFNDTLQVVSSKMSPKNGIASLQPGRSVSAGSGSERRLDAEAGTNARPTGDGNASLPTPTLFFLPKSLFNLELEIFISPCKF